MATFFYPEYISSLFATHFQCWQNFLNLFSSIFNFYSVPVRKQNQNKQLNSLYSVLMNLSSWFSVRQVKYILNTKAYSYF